MFELLGRKAENVCSAAGVGGGESFVGEQEEPEEVFPCPMGGKKVRVVLGAELIACG